mmetsp:Transcript_2651/g.8875  ORF Transcript_2651/g.8875 Transcript_2651/m.8875 type:complete len:201 (-) Transcript_2651:135-737(-)
MHCNQQRVPPGPQVRQVSLDVSEPRPQVGPALEELVGNATCSAGLELVDTQHVAPPRVVEDEQGPREERVASCQVDDLNRVREGSMDDTRAFPALVNFLPGHNSIEFAHEAGEEIKERGTSVVLQVEDIKLVLRDPFRVDLTSSSSCGSQYIHERIPSLIPCKLCAQLSISIPCHDHSLRLQTSVSEDAESAACLSSPTP